MDPSKGAVADANVTLVQKDKGITRTAISQRDGLYQFAQIPPGAYAITITSPGFGTSENKNLNLLVDTPETLDVTLELASTTSTVNVVEDVQQLNSVNATIGNVLQQTAVQNLPLQTRNVVELLNLQPGVTSTGEVMGARRDQNNITLDGVDSNDNQNALSGLNGTNQNAGFNSALPVPLDSVSELRVTVAGEDATAGRSSGGQVTLVTRSGTNSWHGSAYEYNRNTDLTANYFFNNLNGVSRPQLVRNQFGATFGGPIKKDRAFFFLNYERRIDAEEAAETRLVPSDSLKQGIIQVALGNNTVKTLTAADIVNIDPLHLGVNQGVLKMLQQYPSGNDPSYGADSGLNFSGLRFNAPDNLDNRAYVARLDYILDSQAKHSLSFRGTLSNNQQVLTPAELPGQNPSQTLFSDNRGFSARLTSTLSPALVNVFTVGLTRIGFQQSGIAGTAYSLGGDLDNLQPYNSRANLRINPTWNAADDVNWTYGKHSVAFGFNFRNIDNSTESFANAYPSYSFSQGILRGLGEDINTDTAAYLGGGATLANPNANANAFGTLLGLVNSLNVTYLYQKNGSTLPIGSPQSFDFVTRNYEAYVQDSWKLRKNLTLTYGVRYRIDTPPYEANGLQVATQPGIDQYFGLRAYGQANGIPGNQLPNGDRITYSLNGPVNARQSWYARDSNNLAPRLAIAYAPTPTWVFRAGGSITYDQYGNDLATNVASLGSAGLATSLGFPTSYDFSSSPRFNGTLPALTTAPPGGFPYTPPDVSAIAGTFYGINPNLVAPYSVLLNATVSHQFKHDFTLDVSYVGRLSRKLLAQQDSFSPLIYFKDPKSGQTWVQADSYLRGLYNNGKGITPTTVTNNPAAIGPVAFIEDMFPSLKNHYIPGSATANYFYGIYGINNGSDLDNLHALDRAGAPNNCFTVTGCYTFFSPQGSADPTWSNGADADYHALAATFGHNLSHGVSFHANYTYSHSIDNVSSPTDNSGQFGGDIQNAFMPRASRGPSDFDIRHQFNADVLYQLPVGHGQRFLGTAPGWLNEIVGGWQVGSLIRVYSGLPTVIGGNFVFPTNYWENSVAIPNGKIPSTGVHNDENGLPNLFGSLTAINSFQDSYPGGSGMRGIVRLPGQKNVDISLIKNFALPWEGHALQFRAEAFNAFNNVNFLEGSTTTSTGQYTTGFNNLALTSPSTFGEFTATTDPRVLQLSLRYSF